jgi:hypothetical protein
MLWMGIWVHPYTVAPVKVGVVIWKTGGMTEPKLCVEMSWLRLKHDNDTKKVIQEQPHHI